MEEVNKIDQNDILFYEIASRWWMGWISIPILQDITGSYIAWVVRRKYRNYEEVLKIRERLKS